jgi:hypothetical protein
MNLAGLLGVEEWARLDDGKQRQINPNKQRCRRVLFPNSSIFDGESFRTATTCLAFSYLRDIPLWIQGWRPKAFPVGTRLFLG